MKNVLVISSSPRKNSNSEALAEQFLRGAADAGYHTELISLRGKKIEFCLGCFGCRKLGHCVIADDTIEIVKKMHDADVIAFATPIYYYEMCGQLKTLLDRANPLYGTDYRFTDIYALTTAAENEEFVPKRAEAGITGWVDCFPRAHLAGTVFAGGVFETGTIADHPALQTAYEMGKNA